MKKVFFRILIFTNLLVGGALIISYLSKFIPPSWAFPIAFLGMSYAYILLVFILLTLSLLITKHFRWFLANIILILLGWNSLFGLFNLNFTQSDNYDFRVISYNVKLFDLYNWRENKVQKQKMLSQISEYKPDIISFQEFYYDNKDFPIDSVCVALDMPYYYVTENSFILGFQHFGQAIFSKFPIKNKDLIHYPNTGNMSLYCDIEIKPNQIVRVYSNHMESYRLSSYNSEALKKIENGKTIELSDVQKAYTLFKQSMIKRAYQAEKISAHIQASKYPVIVTGDFNDTPNSFVYHTIKKELKDAFTESGLGFSNTYKKGLIAFRIDYILYQEPLKSVAYQSPELGISDHYPVITDFKLKTKK